MGCKPLWSKRCKKTNFIGLALCLLIGGWFDANHPDTSQYEYLYSDGQFQPPFNSFFRGLAPENWRCFGGKTQSFL
jgi:hypothetical protein